MGEQWEPCWYDERMTRCGSEEEGYRYRIDGRDWLSSTRCEFCREIGVYADTHQCPDCEERIAALTAPLRARLESAERERDEVRTWAERARDTIADYRRAYGTDHRNQELAEALDERAVGVLRDWRLGDFEPSRVALGAAGEKGEG